MGVLGGMAKGASDAAFAVDLGKLGYFCGHGGCFAHPRWINAQKIPDVKLRKN